MIRDTGRALGRSHPGGCSEGRGECVTAEGESKSWLVGFSDDEDNGDCLVLSCSFSSATCYTQYIHTIYTIYTYYIHNIYILYIIYTYYIHNNIYILYIHYIHFRLILYT